MNANDARAEGEIAAARPEPLGGGGSSKPQTGAEYLDSLRDGREVYIYGERVKDVTDASRLPQHRAHGRAPLRRAARRRALEEASWCRPTPATAA